MLFATRRSLVIVVVGLLFAQPVWALNVQRLEPAEIDTLQATVHALEPLISAKKRDGTANVLTWEALYQPLSADQRRFLDAFRALRAETLGATSHYFGEPRTTGSPSREGGEKWRIVPQGITGGHGREAVVRGETAAADLAPCTLMPTCAIRLA